MTRKRDDIAACRQQNYYSITRYQNLDFDDMPPLSGQRREQLLDLLSRPDILSSRELCYRGFLQYRDMDLFDSEMTRKKKCRCFFPTSSINNDSCGDYSGEIEVFKAVSAVIMKPHAALRIRSRAEGMNSERRSGVDNSGVDKSAGRKSNCFFRNSAWSFEPPEKRQLIIHVFEQESNLIPVMLKELSRWDCHVYCYGICHDPEIFDGEGKEILSSCSGNPSDERVHKERKMSFKGAYIVFMDAGSYYFQKLPEHQAVKAPVLEADFSGKNRFPA